jgi:hypothetical protein
MAHAPEKNGRKPTAAQDAARLANLAKGKGRPKGTPNKVTRAVREIAVGLVEDPAYLASLKVRLEEGKAGAMEPVVWYFAFGKPKETIEHSGPNGGPMSMLAIIDASGKQTEHPAR